MPIYEYKCDKCGATYEQLRRMSEADRNLRCPECQSDEVRRQLSSFATGASGSRAGAGCGSSRFT